MRKLITVSCALFACGALHAAAVENPTLRANVGVGLGTMLFESIGSDGLLSQTLAATTNGCVSNQLFFITTGTGGAKKWDTIAANRPLREFVNGNLDTLARDMASGSGESLATLAELAGVPAAERAAFYAKLQAHYADIFTSADVTSDQVVDNLAKQSA